MSTWLVVWFVIGLVTTVAMIAVEISSAAFYIDDDPGVLISLCLFGDGASASIWEPSKRSWAGFWWCSVS